MKGRIALHLIALACAALSAAAWAQTKDFPARPVRMVVPVPPGGSVPAELGAHIKSELGRWAKVVRAAGMRMD